MATALITPFYIDLNFTMTEIGLIAKNAGLWSSVIGGFLGGMWMIKIGINRALWIFGFLQMITIIPFIVLSIIGHNLLFLGVTVGLEAFAMGLGTTALNCIHRKTNGPKVHSDSICFVHQPCLHPSVNNKCLHWVFC